MSELGDKVSKNTLVERIILPTSVFFKAAPPSLMLADAY